MVGLELGYDRDQLGRQAAIGGLLMLLNSPVSLWWHLIAKASRVIDGYVPRPSEGAYYILNIAVSSARRGTGIGMLLLANAIDRARRTGYHSVELDVTRSDSIGNTVSLPCPNREVRACRKGSVCRR